jgi:hypothetical protein
MTTAEQVLPLESICTKVLPTGLNCNQLLDQGNYFELFTEKEHKHNIFLWLEKDDTKYGSLYWAESLSKIPIDKCKSIGSVIPLHLITDIYMNCYTNVIFNKYSDIIKNGQKCCILLKTKSASYILMADSIETKIQWVDSLKNIFNLYKKKVVDVHTSKVISKQSNNLPNQPKYVLIGQHTLDTFATKLDNCIDQISKLTAKLDEHINKSSLTDNKQNNDQHRE